MITVYSEHYEATKIGEILRKYTTIPQDMDHVIYLKSKPEHAITIECTQAERKEVEKALRESLEDTCPFSALKVKCEPGGDCEICRNKHIGWIITDAEAVKEDYAESLTDTTPECEPAAVADRAAVAENTTAIVELDIDCIENHPQNVRKDYSGIEELSDSIKARGILQNLTVVPKPGEPGKYLAVIGNRRLRAARAAGVKTVPCRIADMDEKEQIQTMLLENIQRNDLTIAEQADGFQMMLDLGETVDSLSEKTGFGKTTIYHRLNIAKLDRKTVEQKTKGEFQLSLADFYALEQIEDVKTRDKVLKEASNSNQLRWKAEQAAQEEKRDKNANVIISIILASTEVKKWAKDDYIYVHSGDYDIIKEFDLNQKPPKRITVPAREGETLYYKRQGGGLLLFYKTKKQNHEPTPEEIKEKERKKNRKEIKGIMESLRAEIRDFILHVIENNAKADDSEENIRKEIWNLFMDTEVYISRNDLVTLQAGKYYYECSDEEKQKAKESAGNWGITDQMLALLWALDTRIGDIADYNGECNTRRADLYRRRNAILEHYGWTDPEGIAEVLDGTSDLYAKEEQ